MRLGAIGDVANALVFAAALKDAKPGVRIGWLVHPLAQPLVANNPCVDKVHVLERRGGLRAVRRVLRDVRRADYDLAVDLQRLAKSSLLARMSGAPRVLGYDRGRCKEGSWLLTRERIPPGSPTAHMVDQYLEFARYLGVEDPVARHVLPSSAEAEAWAERWVQDVGSAPILVNLGATKPANRWDPARFGELAVRLSSELGAPVCFTGGPDDRVAERRAMSVAGDAARVHSLVGETDLLRLVALLGRARLFIGCDTGPMHLAVARGAPAIALFGPADPRRTGPFGGETVVRVPPPCAPCNRRHCNQPRHACMEDITVEQVLEAARRRLPA